MTKRGELSAIFREGGIHPDESSMERLSLYLAELLKWNRKINLTALRSWDDMAIRLFFDSAFVAKMLPENVRVLDIGSGAGFPGMVMAIMRTDSRFVFAEARTKKIAFLKRIVNLAGVENGTIFDGRLDKSSAGGLGSFDLVVSKAAGPPGRLLSLGKQCLGRGGRYILMAGGGAPVSASGFTLKEKIEYELPRGHGSRKLIIYERL